MSQNDELPVVRVSELSARADDEPAWLVEALWSAGAVGVIGGSPKSCKSWLSLEMAVAVASGKPCLGRFEVASPGPVLLLTAEEPPVEVRDRLEGLAQARGVDFAVLEVGLILEPSLRLDRAEDLARLRTTVAKRRPRMLILDPWVRLQRVNENDATEVSAILASLRELSRTFQVAIVLVHHTRKSPAEQSGQALRGSSDFHAWGDSNLYLRRKRETITLSIEHRSAASPAPLGLTLQVDDGPVRLEVRQNGAVEQAPKTLADRVLEALNGTSRRQEDLRALLRVRNQRLTEVLRQLEADSLIHREAEGWVRLPPP